MCGDSTDKADVDRLMDGNKADMVFTDPPYGIDYQSNMRKQKFNTIENDDRFITKWIKFLPEISNGWVFIWTTWKVLKEWITISESIGECTNMVIWDKGGGGIGDLKKTFSTDYEIAIVFNRGAEITGKRLGSVWEINKDNPTKYKHPTQKPVDLCAMALTNCTTDYSVILDLFLGSGSTLIACEKTNRQCYGMEIDPHYCSVIIQRYKDFCGKDVVKAKKAAATVRANNGFVKLS